MAFDPVKRVNCGGCNNGYLRRGKETIPHEDCGATGFRIPKNYGRPVKAASRVGQRSPWTKKAKDSKRK